MPAEQEIIRMGGLTLFPDAESTRLSISPRGESGRSLISAASSLLMRWYSSLAENIDPSSLGQVI